MKNRTHYPTKKYIRLLTWLIFAVFVKVFRITKKMPREVQQLKPPYLVLGNHVGYWDPFVTGHFLPYFTHFVSSDTTMRSPLIKFFLTRLGTIPIKKNIRDTKVIRDIISVIRQGENVGIFPEALRNWSGSNFKMDPSIAKLIKLLKVPVVVPILKGMNLFNPRWSTKLRYTKVEVEYHLLFDLNELKNLTSEKVFTRLNEVLQHDEVAYQQKVMNKIHSKHKAEHISHALYICPSCQSIDSFRATENDFICTACQYDIHINEYSFFERISDGKLFFDNIRDWYNWEEKWLLDNVKNKFDAKSEAILIEDKNSQFYHSSTDGELDFVGIVNLKLYIDRIVVEFLSKSENLVLNFDDLQTINPQINDRLEIYYNNEAYRFVGERPGVSGLKWEVAVNALWRKLGQNHKLSIYIEQD